MNDPMSSPLPDAPTPRPPWRRFLPLLAIVAALVLVFTSGLWRYLSFQTLKENRAALHDLVAGHRWLAGGGFVALYTLAVALSMPGAVVLTVAGGFLFGSLLGTVLVVVGATAGATLLYLAARTALGDLLRARAGNAVRRLEQGFRDDALSYMLFLRLVPLFPFWLVNLAAAALNVPLRVFVLGTLVGIIPGSFVYAQVGAGVGSVFDQGGEPSLANVLTPAVVVALVGLALLALLPVIYRRLRGGGPPPPSRP